MAYLPLFSRNRRERLTTRRRGRRLKWLPLLFLVGVAVLTIHALIKSFTLDSSTTRNDLSIPTRLAQSKVPSDATVKPIPIKAVSHFINGWQRLKPSHGGTVYGEIDPFTTGKSCRWQPTNFHYPKKLLSCIFFFSRASFLGTWICRDCGENEPAAEWERCPELHPRGKCPAFDYQGWEEPKPRSSSTYDHFSSSPFPVRLITSYGVGKVRKVEYEQPQCLSMRKPCFDMNRCIAPTFGGNSTISNRKLAYPIPVFAYPGQARADVQHILDGGNSVFPVAKIRFVDDPQMACLLVSHADDLNNAKGSSSWNLGANHYVYGVTKPVSENVHYDMSALGSVAITEAQLRPEYDIPLPLAAIWKLKDLYDKVPNSRRTIEDLHRPRKYLMTFKGSIQDTLQPYYQHRWLAAEYLHEEPGVVIDVQCKHKTLWGDTVAFARYDNQSQDNFDDLMVNSTFAFCPGGSHVTSFRFTEVLSAGAIPVLLPEIVTPFYPEVDWSDCVIRVSQARIVDLPRVLRAIPPETVRKRQLQCQKLYRAFLELDDDDEEKTDTNLGDASTSGYLAAALKVWQLRLEKQHHGNRLAELLASGSNENEIHRS